jgi:hypothetical protein
MQIDITRLEQSKTSGQWVLGDVPRVCLINVRLERYIPR